ncbi:fasciclin domain-containing protein [Salinarimonas chemoclinalis]|uniref:fasciclin domain-containing protein n=1 Tax=Salinarimonas chemoclinalis TaxID=3241599 RepID=UPI0035587176
MKTTLRRLARHLVLGAAVCVPLALGAGLASAQAVKTVGGAPMLPSRTIVENAVNSADHTTLVAAVQAAGLVDTLSGPGPFTVFAPTNRAFSRLPAGTVDTLLEPANRGQLTDVLTFHVVPGTYTASELLALAQREGGQAELRTVEGGTLAVLLDRNGNGPYIADNQGNTARVPISDVMQSNGVIHVIDKVLLP